MLKESACLIDLLSTSLDLGPELKSVLVKGCDSQF